MAATFHTSYYIMLNYISVLQCTRQKQYGVQSGTGLTIIQNKIFCATSVTTQLLH